MDYQVAIEIIKEIQDNYKSDDGYDYVTNEYHEEVEALDMAIEALKQHRKQSKGERE